MQRVVPIPRGGSRLGNTLSCMYCNLQQARATAPMSPATWACLRTTLIMQLQILNAGATLLCGRPETHRSRGQHRVKLI